MLYSKRAVPLWQPCDVVSAPKRWCFGTSFRRCLAPRMSPKLRASASKTRQVGVYTLIKHNMLIRSNGVFDVLYRLQVS
jgi:hypothetical protein